MQYTKGLKDFVYYIGKYHKLSELTILEVGSWAGDSAVVFAEHFKKVICVDPWEPTPGTVSERENIYEIEKIFDKMIRRFNNIEKLKNRIENVIDTFQDRSIDVIYIDGDHRYSSVVRDIKLCLPKCKLYLSGHDYCNIDFKTVVQAVDDTLGKRDIVFSDTSWIYKIDL
jgi:hypothetical protein